VYLRAEPLSVSGTLYEALEGVLPVQGSVTPILRSGVLCTALGCVHSSRYPPTPEPSLRTLKGTSKDGFRV
jgi:hypothetical protein